MDRRLSCAEILHTDHIMVISSPPHPPVDPDNSKNIQPISFKFCMWVETPLRYFVIEFSYSPYIRTTAFAV